MKDEASESLIEGHQVSRHASRRINFGFLAHLTLTIFFFCTTLFFALRRQLAPKNSTPVHDYETGFSTDFVSSITPIPINIIQKRFTNDLLFHSTSQTLYNQPLTPNETTYVGPPSPALDAAWDSLLHAQYISLLPNETSQIPPSHLSPIFYNGEHYFMELAVFHNLHCLNEIRVALNGNSDYERRDLMHEGRTHLDHCVDQLRQAVMCHADLTPVPMKKVTGGEGKGSFYIGNGEEHTCRDFDRVWEWVEERGRMFKALGD